MEPTTTLATQVLKSPLWDVRTFSLRTSNMTRKIITLAATALSIGALSFAPHAALAVDTQNMTVRAEVDPTADIVVNTQPQTITWTGAAAQPVPFTVTVTSNDLLGYVFTFTGANPTPFELVGTGGNTTVVPYTVTGTAGDVETYTSGAPGANAFTADASAGVLSTFNVNLPVQAAVPADIYSDTLTVLVTPVALD